MGDRTPPVRFRRVELTARKALGDTHAAGGPVDVAPAQGKQLALAQPRHGRSQVQRALDRAECIGRYGTQDGVELLWLQEADSAMGRAVGPRPLDQGDGV